MVNVVSVKMWDGQCAEQEFEKVAPLQKIGVPFYMPCQLLISHNLFAPQRALIYTIVYVELQDQWNGPYFFS